MRPNTKGGQSDLRAIVLTKAMIVHREIIVDICSQRRFPAGTELTSGPRRLGLRAENHASGERLSVPASAGVGRASTNNHSSTVVIRCVGVETGPTRIGTPAAWFSG